MAPEARRGRLRIAEAEARGDLLAPAAAEHGIGPAMRAAGRGRLLPAGDLVLSDDRTIALGPAVAGGTRAAGDTFECGIADGARGRIECSEADHRQHPHELRPADEACDPFRDNSRHAIPPEMPYRQTAEPAK